MARFGSFLVLRRWFVLDRLPVLGQPLPSARDQIEGILSPLLRRHLRDLVRVTHNSRAGNYAPRVFVLRPDRERFAKADFERAMQALFAARSIVVVKRKALDRKFYECIEPAAAEKLE